MQRKLWGVYSHPLISADSSRNTHRTYNIETQTHKTPQHKHIGAGERRACRSAAQCTWRDRAQASKMAEADLLKAKPIKSRTLPGAMPSLYLTTHSFKSIRNGRVSNRGLSATNRPPTRTKLSWDSFALPQSAHTFTSILLNTSLVRIHFLESSTDASRPRCPPATCLKYTRI